MECVYRLLPTVNQYSWGRKAEASLVYSLFERYFGLAGVKSRNLDLRGPFSELWLGTHKSGPSTVIPLDNSELPRSGPAKEPGSAASVVTTGCDVYLADVLRSLYLDLHGTRGRELKILFKVLSIDKALSVQMHPDDESAASLFASGHEGIVDSSAKPEMAVALTRFRAMCGFRPLSEVSEFARRHREFAEALGLESPAADIALAPNAFFVGVLKRLSEDASLSRLVDSLAARLRQSPAGLAEEFFLTLYDTYGSDPCVFFSFLLNCFELSPGEALFLAPNVMHSYVSGNCIEVMKNSDNVIRCAFTPKFKDLALCLRLIGERSPVLAPREFLVAPEAVSEFVRRYAPAHPACNFTVWSFRFPAGTQVGPRSRSGHLRRARQPLPRHGARV